MIKVKVGEDFKILSQNIHDAQFDDLKHKILVKFGHIKPSQIDDSKLSSSDCSFFDQKKDDTKKLN